jgi:hypothetical protein
MDFNHLHVRCGPYRILVPGQNVIGINPAGGDNVARIPRRRALDAGLSLMIDARLLLGLEPAARSDPQVHVHWKRSDDELRAVLVVDAVEGLRGGFEAEFLPLPRVPQDFQRLFDGLVANTDDGFLLRLRKDIYPILDKWRDRRRFCRAVIGAVAAAA